MENLYSVYDYSIFRGYTIKNWQKLPREKLESFYGFACDIETGENFISISLFSDMLHDCEILEDFENFLHENGWARTDEIICQ